MGASNLGTRSKCVIIARCTLIPEVAAFLTDGVMRLMSISSYFLLEGLRGFTSCDSLGAA